jgi:dGTPase
MNIELEKRFQSIKNIMIEKSEIFKKILIATKIQSKQRKKNFFLFLNQPDEKDSFSDEKTKIIFSNHFRKLAYKTQVFFNNFGDYNRTRLTHSLEVSEISKTICDFLGLNSSLSECISLSHDIGHTPFGHSGEDGLNLALKEFNFEKFNHNVQSIKIVTSLEEKFSENCGLNLSSYILDGLIKHNGSVYNQKDLISNYDYNFLLDVCIKNQIDPKMQTHLEGQIASISDDIAYTNHDIEDGFRSGFLKLKDLKNLPIIGNFLYETEKKQGASDEKRLIYELMFYFTNLMIFDSIENFFEQIEKNNIKSHEEIFHLENQIFDFSDSMKKTRLEIKNFLFKNLYQNPEIMTQRLKKQNIVRNLFIFYFENQSCLPFKWQESIQNLDQNQKHQVIKDFVSGMTDRFAMEAYNKIF